MKKYIFIICMVILFGCNTTQRVKDRLVESFWVVSKVYYNGKLYEKSDYFFSYNVIDFESNGSCTMPDFGFDKNRSTQWYLYKVEKDTFYIEINNSDQNFLDGTYKGVFDYGDKYILKMTLVSDNITLYCETMR